MTGDRLAAHPTWMEVDRGALGFNLAEIRRRSAPGVKVIASVKANAYGHGIVPVARVLESCGADMLATGSFAEAQAMRGAGIATPILMLAGALPEAMADLLALDAIPTVYDMAAAQAVSAPATAPATVFVKVDGGLGRLGVPLDAAAGFVAAVANLPRVVVGGLYTHDSFKDAAGMAYSRARLALFARLVDRLAAEGHAIPVTQALASSALMQGWTDGCTAVCPGHVLYGMPSVTPALAPIAPFRPVLKAVTSRVIQVADHAGGPAIGSGGYHLARRSRRTAVMPCGLNDGYRPARAGQTAEVLHRGRRLTVIGVSLEHLTVDVPDDVDIRLGDPVTVAGGDGPRRIDPAEIGAWQGASALEVMLSLSGRMPVTAVG